MTDNAIPTPQRLAPLSIDEIKRQRSGIEFVLASMSMPEIVKGMLGEYDSLLADLSTPAPQPAATPTEGERQDAEFLRKALEQAIKEGGIELTTDGGTTSYVSRPAWAKEKPRIKNRRAALAQYLRDRSPTVTEETEGR